MIIEIEQVDEQEDGSATMRVKLDMEMLRFLAEQGLLRLISAAADAEISKLESFPEE